MIENEMDQNDVKQYNYLHREENNRMVEILIEKFRILSNNKKSLN